MTKAEYFDILNKIELKYNCNLNHRDNGGIIWLHQDAGDCVDVQKELAENRIPRWTHWCAFDQVCGRYYVGFDMPRKMEE